MNHNESKARLLTEIKGVRRELLDLDQMGWLSFTGEQMKSNLKPSDHRKTIVNRLRLLLLELQTIEDAGKQLNLF